MSYTAVPAELRALDRWVVWCWEPDPEKPDKQKKPPYCPSDLGRHASSTNPGTWATFETALAVVEAGKADGVGFALEAPFVGVDLDEELPEIDQHAVMVALDSYAERSPSGSGHHVVLRGSLNGHGRHPIGIGVFQTDRFFYCTGNHVHGTPTTIEDRQAQLDDVLARFLPPRKPLAEISARQPVDLDDRDLIDKAMAARNGLEFRALWQGETGRFDGDHSAADLALCRRLAFWTSRDADRIDRMFRVSGLMREKWNRPDYAARTIDAAIASCHDVYVPRGDVGSLQQTNEDDPTFGEDTPFPPAGAEGDKPSVSASVAGIAWQRLSEVEMRSIVFVDRPLLQADAFHLVCGRKGMGKGTVLSEIASRVTRGELGSKRNVVWIGSEDSNSIDVRPRVEAASGDPGRVLVIKTGWIQLPRDVDEISRAMADMGEVGMLVLDPVGNHIAGKNSNSETDIRDAIAPLNGIADEHKAMVFGVRHLSEKECSQGVIAAILGSSAWVQVPRAVLAIVRDNEDPQISHVQCVEGNRLPPGTPGRMVRIEGVLLPGLENEVTRAVWIGDSSKNVETMLGTRGAETKTDRARELILDILDDDGPQESDTLDARVAHETGLAIKTVKNARTGLKDEGLIKVYPEKDETGAIQRWRVARSGAPRP
jgi:putative DNA primase/helicase